MRCSARIDADLDRSLERLFALLRIKSISADPHYKEDCREAAEWCARYAERDRHRVARCATRSAIRWWSGTIDGAGEGAPHVLFYGHYDVQPVDPVSLWDRDPFDPAVVEVNGEKRIVARGAEDDKGQLMTFVEAARAWMAETGRLPVNLTVLFEGEEELASPSMVPFLTANAEELKADIALVCDTSMWDRKTPAITTMLRGLRLRGGVRPGGEPRPAFGHVRQRGAQPDPRAGENPRRPARRERPRHDPRLL